MDTYLKVIDHLKALFEIEPQVVVTDKHPGYLSHRFAYSTGLPVIELQHHVAHALSVMEENQLSKAIAIVYDGTDMGTTEHYGVQKCSLLKMQTTKGCFILTTCL